MRSFLLTLLAISVFAFAPAISAAAESPVFCRTQESDEWVSESLKVQSEYARVLVVGEAGKAPKTLSVSGADFSGKGAGAEKEYPVAEVFATLAAAAQAARGGDLVAVMPGIYAGFVFEDKESAGDGAYIHFKALGKPGEVTINRTAEGTDSNWMVNIHAGHHVIVEGFNIAGATGPGMEEVGPQAGIFINGDFRNTGKMAHHIAIVGNFSHNHRSWGLHSTDSHTVLMQDNLFALNCREHSAYVSDGSDNYCIRRNVFFASRCSGLQCNLDPDASFNELTAHPEMASFLPVEPTREWGQAILAAANEKFGEHNYPDGRGINFIIESNVIYGNGQAGGGSFNFAGLQDSLIQNNLVYGNLTTGIAQWDNGNSFDTELASPGPATADDFKGPDSLSYWGCYRNTIRNNTVVMNVSGRVAMLLNNGSWGNTLRNNIFLNDLSFSMEVTNTSVYKLDSARNVLNRITYNDMDASLFGLATSLDTEKTSTLGVTLEAAGKEFVRFSDEPWVIIEGNWWRLNPDRPDFRPKADGALFVGKGDASQLPAIDIDGARRDSADIGAYARGGKD